MKIIWLKTLATFLVGSILLFSLGFAGMLLFGMGPPTPPPIIPNVNAESNIVPTYTPTSSPMPAQNNVVVATPEPTPVVEVDREATLHVEKSGVEANAVAGAPFFEVVNTMGIGPGSWSRAFLGGEGRINFDSCLDIYFFEQSSLKLSTCRGTDPGSLDLMCLASGFLVLLNSCHLEAAKLEPVSVQTENVQFDISAAAAIVAHFPSQTSDGSSTQGGEGFSMVAVLDSLDDSEKLAIAYQLDDSGAPLADEGQVVRGGEFWYAANKDLGLLVNTAHSIESLPIVADLIAQLAENNDQFDKYQWQRWLEHLLIRAGDDAVALQDISCVVSKAGVNVRSEARVDESTNLGLLFPGTLIWPELMTESNGMIWTKIQIRESRKDQVPLRSSPTGEYWLYFTDSDTALDQELSLSDSYSCYFNHKTVSELAKILPTPTSTPIATYTPSPTPTPMITPTPTQAPIFIDMPGRFDYGVQAHMVDQVNEAQVMGMTQNLRFGWIKQQIEWKRFEPGQGAIDFGPMDAIVNAANGADISLLFSVVNAPRWARENGFDNTVGGPPADPATYARFVGKVAGKYCNSSLKAIEVWNEQNLHYEWGNKPLNAGEYVNLLAAAYSAIKDACPNMTVVSGALTPAGNNGNLAIDDFTYLEQMFQAGANNYLDAVGAHPSGYNVPPQYTWQEACDAIQITGNSFNGACDSPHHSWSFRSTMEGYRNIANTYGAGNKRIWPTEFGWAAGGAFNPNYQYANDNDFTEQAEWTVQAFQMMKQWGWVGPAFLWNLNFRMVADGTEKAQWGIVDSSGTPLPAYNELQSMSK